MRACGFVKSHPDHQVAVAQVHKVMLAMTMFRFVNTGRKESGLEISTSVVRVIASIGVDYSASSLFRFRLFDGKKSGVAIRGCQVIESGE